MPYFRAKFCFGLTWTHIQTQPQPTCRFLSTTEAFLAKFIPARYCPANHTSCSRSFMSFLLFHDMSHVTAGTSVLSSVSFASVPVLLAPKEPLQSTGGGCCQLPLLSASVFLSWHTRGLYPGLEALTLSQENAQPVKANRCHQVSQVLRGWLPALRSGASPGDALSNGQPRLGFCLPPNLMVTMSKLTFTECLQGARTCDYATYLRGLVYLIFTFWTRYHSYFNFTDDETELGKIKQLAWGPTSRK